MDETPASVRRRHPRRKAPPNLELKLGYMEALGRPKMLRVSVIDISEEGCGFESDTDLPIGTPVVLHGKLGAMPVEVKGAVVWSSYRDGAYRMGIRFAEPIALEQDASFDADTPDYYDILQLNPGADPDMIHRVYRLLAQRYHPAQAETGNPALFRKVTDAYRVLSDPEKRAAYDIAYRQKNALKWKIFGAGDASTGAAAEKAKRRGILGVLYTKRVHSPDHPEMSLMEIEELVGVAREHLQFSLWYLRERGLAARTDNGRFAITVSGVDYVEAAGVPEPEERPAEPQPELAVA